MMTLQLMFQVIYSKNELQAQLMWSVRYDALDQSLTLSANEPTVSDGEPKKFLSVGQIT